MADLVGMVDSLVRSFGGPPLQLVACVQVVDVELKRRGLSSPSREDAKTTAVDEDQIAKARDRPFEGVCQVIREKKS